MLKNYLKPAGLEDLCVLMDATDPGLGLVEEPQSPAELEDLSPTTLSVLMDASVAADPEMSLVEKPQPPAGLEDLSPTTLSFLINASEGADQVVGLVVKPQPPALVVGEVYTPNGPSDAPNHHQELPKSPMVGGGPISKKKHNVC